MSWLGIDKLGDSDSEEKGECACGGETCPEAHGWVWKSSDLGHSSHRGKMWCEICPMWNKEEKGWDADEGKFALQRVEPPVPPGMSEENFHRYRAFNWDNMEQSRFEKSMNRRHEAGAGHDAGTGIEGGE